MQQQLTILNYEQHEVRTTLIDGEPWFVAADVCKVLEHSDVSMAVSRLDEDEKLVQTLLVSGQRRNVLCVNESGLYHLIFTSRKEEAKTFRKWITGEVLPSIRKHGFYDPSGKMVTLTDRLAHLQSRLDNLPATLGPVERDAADIATMRMRQTLRNIRHFLDNARKKRHLSDEAYNNLAQLLVRLGQQSSQLQTVIQKDLDLEGDLHFLLSDCRDTLSIMAPERKFLSSGEDNQ